MQNRYYPSIICLLFLLLTMVNKKSSHNIRYHFLEMMKKPEIDPGVTEGSKNDGNIREIVNIFVTNYQIKFIKFLRLNDILRCSF